VPNLSEHIARDILRMLPHTILYANVFGARPRRSTLFFVPLRGAPSEGRRLPVVFRENTEGIYAGGMGRPKLKRAP
jgi:isocitrate/isopropylmalate dehydrogenase